MEEELEEYEELEEFTELEEELEELADDIDIDFKDKSFSEDTDFVSGTKVGKDGDSSSDSDLIESSKDTGKSSAGGRLLSPDKSLEELITFEFYNSQLVL